LCVGQAVDLSISVFGSSFIWSNGATTNTISVSEPGLYTAIAYDANGCGANSNAITVSVNSGVQTPTVTVSGALDFCEGLSVQLTASAGASYLWSNGAETQTIDAALPGEYTVQVEGGCGFATSTATTVVVYDAPAAPTAVDVTIGAAGVTADLTATGTNIQWYDVATGGSPIATGSTFTTPAGNGGKFTNDAGAYFANTPTNFNKFDALEDVILDSVFVYSNAAGARTIEVVDANLTVIASATVTIPNDSVYVPLNFFIPAGTGYGLRTSTANPGLWRDRDVTVASPYEYPYDVSGLISITGTTVTNNNQNQDGDNYYYFFYKWHAHTPSFDCPSPREEVVISIVGVEELETISNVVVFPNPAADHLTVRLNSANSGAMNVNLIDALGKMVQVNQVTVSTGTQNIELNLNGIAPGIYELQMVKDGKASSKRIVVR
jgi:hypothetical protein